MGSEISLSLVLAITIVAAPLAGSTRTCILSNTPSERACKAACCSNMVCCETSEKNTAPGAPPIVKTSVNENPEAVIAASVTIAPSMAGLPDEHPRIPEANLSAHSPPILALVCVRLI